MIGAAGSIPWHLPEDFKWFKKATMGQVLVMGRRTFESIGRPLPGRETFVLTRRGIDVPEVRSASGIAALDEALADDPRDVFIAGGAEVYAQLLHRCSDLYLTRVKRIVPGDICFPPFEDQFVLAGTVMETEEFVVEHHRHRSRLIA